MRLKVRVLRDLIAKASLNPYVRALAASIVRGIPSRDHLERARAILAWVQENLTYVGEPHEIFTRPERMLLDPDFHFGDCDEINAALAALYESIAFQTVGEALGWGGHFRHYGIRVGLPAGKPPERLLYAEGTIPVALGWDPAKRIAAKEGTGELQGVASLAQAYALGLL